jgi:hypothetical protein
MLLMNMYLNIESNHAVRHIRWEEINSCNFMLKIIRMLSLVCCFDTKLAMSPYGDGID